MNFWKYLLLPFSGLYALAIFFRNYWYNNGYTKSISFDIPVIAVGNLSVGGTGKTPHIEYLIKLIAPHYKTATLSRGYRRKSQGFIMAQKFDDANLLGDEPFLLHQKYPQVQVCVGEDRLTAIPQIIADAPDTVVVLMDDAFQHRAVKAQLSILLTTYSNPYFEDFLLPAGRLREFRNGAQRADFIVITKCPVDLDGAKRQAYEKAIAALPNQKVLFSFLRYGMAYNLLNHDERLISLKNYAVLMFCGIAQTIELEQYLQANTSQYWLRTFSDHHYFDRYDLETIQQTFTNIETNNKILLTTEKDAARLWEHREWFIQKKISIFALPIEVAFFKEDQAIFNTAILNYLQHVTAH